MVADVSGHGAPAAIVMAMIRAVLHTYPGVARRSAGGAALHQPAFPVSVGHRDVCDRGLRRARCRARDDPAVVGRTSAAAASAAGRRRESPPIDTTTCLLWDELREIPCVEDAAAAGDRWLFYTDGITDRQSSNETMFDLERLSAALTSIGARAGRDRDGDRRRARCVRGGPGAGRRSDVAGFLHQVGRT